MTKLWNPTTQLTPLNNYLNNCVIATSYKPIVKKNWTLGINMDLQEGMIIKSVL